MRTLGTGIRRYTEPSVTDFTRSGGKLTTSAPEFLRGLGWEGAAIEHVLGEYREVTEELATRYADTALCYPRTHGVEAETSAVLYGLSRLLKPQSVVETGVADGRSSWLILAALERNGSGMLHSFDVNHAAGRLVGQHPQWQLEILDGKDPASGFSRALERVGSIDLFFHDSDHLYLPQLFEYGQAWPRMTPGSVFASDDVNCSRAFLDFCGRRRQRPVFLFDSRKITGAVRLPGVPRRRAEQLQQQVR
ncbi:class I SAM-dependent methyltransferase [Streptomyces sp. NPDC006430]|uniref:class I SAM-dependent methyltransferase n=1 Tax=Streptomyces sp. NPDC006430 TaxID=3154299 RepID=UPI0033A71CED